MISLEERGDFWWHDEPIPNGYPAPESSVTGILKIDEEGRVELELENVLSSDPFDDPFAPPDKSIQGILNSSNEYALLIEPVKSGERYLAIDCLVGSSPFPKTEEPLRFRNFQVNLKGFEEWLGLGSIEVNRTKSSISARYEFPQNISYPLDDGTLSIKYDISGPYFSKETRHSLTLSEKASICYAPNQSALLGEMKAIYGLMEDLFFVLTDSDYRLDWPLLSYEKDKKNYRFYFLRHRSSAPAPNWHECCTTFVQLRDNFGQIFSIWKKKREVFGPGFYLYLSTRRGIKLYPEHRFVTLIWGIESLHRRKTPESPTPSNLKKKIQRILDQVTDKKDKRWLENQLKHADEPPLNQRIYETFNDLPLGLDENMLRRFSKDCADSRHDISHYGGQRRDGNHLDLVALEKKSDALSYLYHALLLQELSVDSEYKGFKSYVIKSALVDVGLLTKSALTVAASQHGRMSALPKRAELMLTVKQISEKMNVTTSRILQRIWKGEYPGARKSGRAWLIPEPKAAKPSGKAPVKALLLTPKQHSELSARTKAGLDAARAAGRKIGRPPKKKTKATTIKPKQKPSRAKTTPAAGWAR